MKLHGPTIRIRRLELGLTLDDVYRATDIDVSNLSKVERGLLGGVNPRRAKALAECLQMPMHKLAPELAELKQRAGQ